jgi:GNAT superfamily N-acetyltransferase
MTKGDEPFVHSSFHTDYWQNGKHHNPLWEVYAPEMDQHIDRLIRRSTVYVAYYADVPDEILGYSILDKDGDTVHFVYVKSVYRKMGIGSGLVPDRRKWYTHATRISEPFVRSLHLTYNPFRLHAPA